VNLPKNKIKIFFKKLKNFERKGCKAKDSYFLPLGKKQNVQ
jgi:hypothetical protein